MKRDDRRALALLALVVVALGISGVAPYDRHVWGLEVLPWIAALGVVVAIHRRYPMTFVSQVAIAVLCLLFTVGAHFTYTRVPPGLWLRDALDLTRNPYDRVAHFAGGFVAGLVIREALLRRTRLVRGGRTFLLVSLVALAGSAFYEIVEWWIAIAVRRSAEEFLAMQGDPWDTQWDMLLAVVAAMIAQLLLGRLQDREMAARGLKREA